MCEIAGCIGTDEAGKQTLGLLSEASDLGTGYAGISFGDPTGEGFRQRLVTSLNYGDWEESPVVSGNGSGSWALGVLESGPLCGVPQPRVMAVNGMKLAYAYGSIRSFRTDSLGWRPREESLRALNAQGHRVADDTEDILQFLLRQTDPQRSVVRRLDEVLSVVDGDYCFAFLCERCLVIARHAFGVRPIFVSRRGASFFFGSNESALRSCGELWREVEPGYMAILRADGFSRLRSIPQPLEVSAGPYCPFSVKVDCGRRRW